MAKIPFLARIVIAIALGIALGFVMPGAVIRGFNTFNGIFNQLLGFLVPLIILGFVTSAIAELGRGAGKMLALTAAIAYCGTVVSGLFAYGCSTTLFPSFIGEVGTAGLSESGTSFPPFFTIAIPPLMGVMTALVTSFLLGLGIAAFDARTLQQVFFEFKDIVTLAISKVILPLLPVYIFGLFLDMTAVGSIGRVMGSFLIIIAIIFAMTAVLLVLQYCVAGAVVHRNPFRLLARMMPAYFTALGTASSAATIPVTLQQTIRNGVSPEVAGFTIPLCATIHMSGSMLKITSCAVALMLMQGIPFDFPLMLGFVMMLGITMVAAPGVPGGSIMAALGVLDGILGFTSQPQAMMITLYIAMDSFGTACNVTGDGAIALIIDKIKNRR